MGGSRSFPDWLGFEERTITTAASGQPVESWTVRFPRNGRVVLKSATEPVRNDQQITAEGYQVTLPYDLAAGRVTAKAWRIRWRDQLGVVRLLNLTGVDTTARGRRAELVLSAVLDR